MFACLIRRPLVLAGWRMISWHGRNGRASDRRGTRRHAMTALQPGGSSRTPWPRTAEADWPRGFARPFEGDSPRTVRPVAEPREGERRAPRSRSPSPHATRRRRSLRAHHDASPRPHDLKPTHLEPMAAMPMRLTPMRSDADRTPPPRLRLRTPTRHRWRPPRDLADASAPPTSRDPRHPHSSSRYAAPCRLRSALHLQRWCRRSGAATPSSASRLRRSRASPPVRAAAGAASDAPRPRRSWPPDAAAA